MEGINTDNYRRSCVFVDLDNLRENFISASRNLRENTKLCAVVKTDAYGLGAVMVAHAIDDLANYYAVASLEEGIMLRRNNIKTPILILGVIPENQYKLAIENSLTTVVTEEADAEAINKAALELGMKAYVHLALDTGMGRIGFSYKDPLIVDKVLKIKGYENVIIEGLFTHFSTADEKDQDYTKLQLDRFIKIKKSLEDAEIQIPIYHCSNSAAIISGTGTDFNMARDGISLYGVYPSDEVIREGLSLKPVISWKSMISYVKHIGAGESISYGRKFTSEHEMDIATVTTGYGDGYKRDLSMKSHVIVNGKKAPVLGRICMDQFMIDVSGIDVSKGDIVTLIGEDGDCKIDMEDIRKFGCFPYSFLTDINRRVPRVYKYKGRVYASRDSYSESYKFVEG